MANDDLQPLSVAEIPASLPSEAVTAPERATWVHQMAVLTSIFNVLAAELFRVRSYPDEALRRALTNLTTGTGVRGGFFLLGRLSSSEPC